MRLLQTHWSICMPTKCSFESGRRPLSSKQLSTWNVLTDQQPSEQCHCWIATIIGKQQMPSPMWLVAVGDNNFRMRKGPPSQQLPQQLQACQLLLNWILLLLNNSSTKRCCHFGLKQSKCAACFTSDSSSFYQKAPPCMPQSLQLTSS